MNVPAHLSLVLFFVSFYCAPSLQQEPGEIKCLVCQSMVDEIQNNITTIKSNLKADVGGYTIDNEGNMHTKQVSYSHSTVYLSELMDHLCTKMEDYVKAVHKETGKVVIMPLVINGVMNSLMQDVDVIQDPDLNKNIKYYCEEIVAEYEDLIIDMVQLKVNNLKYKICSQELALCPAGGQDGGHDEL